ncbi:MAG TPA: dephospho-CoA kinase [Aquaticitalea sp.]|nr:dephospho-CoA kinase [Aquaticitalea sp.]
MIIVGLTGGIGSGKTTVANFFKELAVPVYIADVEAKRLMDSSADIQKELISLFGEQAYHHNKLNRPFVASRIFKDASLLAQMNAIVHPEVALDFKRWVKKQTTAYVIKEAAIIFEHNKQSDYDFIITVTASMENRVARLKKRDNTSEDKILDIINNQLSDKEKIEKSDFVIVNDRLAETKKNVLKIHLEILQNLQETKF